MQNNKQIKTLLMGILNVTNDSFSGDGIIQPNSAISWGEQLIAQGADILDIGGESSKPGAQPISEKEEINRVIPIIQHFAKKDNIILSVDTCKPRVAEMALKAGAHIVNDITGLNDPEMALIVAKHKAKIVIMHMQGNPQTMQQKPVYENILKEISDYFSERIERAISAGIPMENIILDPGIGFGKTLDHNITILKNIAHLKSTFSCPILIGTSRKSFIGTLTGKQDPQDRIFGTASSVAISIANGADIVRVHDVKEMRDVAKVVDALK